MFAGSFLGFFDSQQEETRRDGVPVPPHRVFPRPRSALESRCALAGEETLIFGQTLGVVRCLPRSRRMHAAWCATAIKEKTSASPFPVTTQRILCGNRVSVFSNFASHGPFSPLPDSCTSPRGQALNPIRAWLPPLRTKSPAHSLQGNQKNLAPTPGASHNSERKPYIEPRRGELT